VLPALLLTCACDALGQKLHPEFYEIRAVLWKPVSWQGYVSSLFFANEFQTFPFKGLVPGTNAPYWSLSFEAAYYVVAGLVLFAPLRYALPIALVLLAIAGRTIAALLPLWVLGFCLYKTRERLAERLPFPAVLLILSTAAIAAFPRFHRFASMDNFGVNFPWGHGPYNRNLLLDYATAFAFTVQMIAAQRLLSRVQRPPPPFERGIRWLGSTTFPLYAMHYPVLCLFAALSPFERTSWVSIAFVSAAVLTVVAVMTPICEWLKDKLRWATPTPSRSVGSHATG